MKSKSNLSRHVKLSAAVAFTIEQCERRILLSSSSSDLLAALPGTDRGEITPTGLEISLAPISGVSTPDYELVDPQPQLTADGSLAPFATAGPTGMTAAKMRHAYGVDQITFGAVQGDGTGQTIAIIDAYDYPTASTDLHGFDVAFGLPDPPSLTRVNETGGSTLPGTDPAAKGSDWEVEEALDIEWSHAMAPGASIVLVEATSPSDADLITAAATYARSAPGVVAVTMSFGRAENSTDTTLDPTFTTPVGHGGVTFLASTGDNGEPGGYPSFSPNVVAVGGTTLSVDASGNYISEAGWSGSGGGLSTIESQPTYQAGIVTQSTTQRATPDISFDADPASGASVYDTYDFGTTTPWLTVGGTSLASPSWAGLIAIADQGRTLGGGNSLDGIGNTLPKLYSLSTSNFHDIVTGSNGFSAGAGYDLITGRGSPVANTLLPLLSAAGPFVTGTLPNGAGTTPLSSVAFNFSATMDPTSFNVAADVDSFIGPGNTNLLGQITGFSWLNGNTTLQVNFTTQNTVGHYTMVIGPQILSSGGFAMDQNQNGVPGEATADRYTAAVGYETTLLQVASTNPANGSLVVLPFTTLNVHFNEPFDPALVGTSNLTLSQGSVTAASIVDSSTLSYTLSGITAEGPLTVSMRAGALNDSLGFGMVAYTGTLLMDIPTRAMPATTSVAPAGSLIYQSSTTGTISTTTDVDNLTISLDAGQTLTVVAHPTNGTLRPALSVLGPTNAVLGIVTAGAVNQDAVLETIPVTTAGTYTIVVSGGSTTGQYSLQALLNAGVELEEHNGSSDDTIATAQNLDPAFSTLVGGASIGSVVGALATSATDFYSVTLAAGQPAAVTLATTSGSGTPSLGLYDSLGNLLASGATTATNVQASISNYIAPAAGTYYVKVTGTGIGYSLVVTKSGAFNLEPNDSLASAQVLSSNQPVVGYVSGGGGSAALDTFDSGNLNAYTFTGADFATVTAAAAHDGPFGLATATTLTDWFYRNDAAAHTQRGETVSVWVRSTGTLTGRAYFGFGATSAGSLSIIMAPNTGQFIIEDNTGFQFTVIGSVAQVWQANHWYRMQANWQTSGTIVANLYDSDGTTLLNTVTATQTTISSGGIAFRAFGDAYNMDSATIGSGLSDVDVYSVSLTAGNPTAFSTNTPSGGPGEFTNALDPALQLYDPSGNLVASDDNSASDGRNALLKYTPVSTGVYHIEVLASAVANSSGEYVLSLGNGLGLTLPSNVHEGDGTVTGTIVATAAPSADLTINLASSDSSRLSTPATVILPAGQTSVSFQMNVIDDSLLNGPEAVTITSSASGYFSGSGVVNVHDNETAVLGISLPASAHEGDGTVAGTITSSAAPSSDIVVQLSSNLTSRITVRATVTIKAGQTSANFIATVVDNSVIDGTQAVTVTGSVENWTSGSATVNVADNDATIVVTLPASGWEGQTLTSAGTVTIGGTLSTALQVNLLSIDTSELTLPASVTIPAGQTSITFTPVLLDDHIKDGSQTAQMTASATGLTSGSASIVVHDADPDHVGIDPIAGTETAAAPFSISVHVYNIANEVIADYSGSAVLSASGQSGTLPLTPTSIIFSAGTFTGNVSITAVDPAATIAVNAGTGLTASSNSFSLVAGPVASFQWGTVPTPEIQNVPLAETLTAKDANGFTVTNFNGTASLSGLVGTGTTSSILISEVFCGTPDAIEFTNVSPSAVNIGGWTAYIYDIDDWPNPRPTSITFAAGTTVPAGGVFQIQEFGTVPGAYPIFFTGENIDWTSSTVTDAAVLLRNSSAQIVDFFCGAAATAASITNPTTIPSTQWQGVTATTPTSDSFSFTRTGNQDHNTAADWVLAAPTVGTTNSGLTVPFPGGATPVSISPTIATFVKGVWSGNITVLAAVAGMHLHADDGSGHTADSNSFDVVQRSLGLSLPSDVREDDGVVTGVINVSPIPNADLVVSLTSSDPSRLSVPSTVTVPAGQSSVNFPVTLIDNNLLDGLEAIGITAAASTYATTTGNINVHDNETASLSISLPSTAREGDAPVTGTITASAAPTRDITVQLSSGNLGRATVPATVILKAGQTTATFSLTIVDNAIIDGTALVSIGAAVDDWASGFKTINVQDNDNFITVTLPASGWEGQTLTSAGTVSIGGTLTTALVINLLSSDTTELTVPASVTIPAGQTSVTFTPVLIDDGIKDGSQTAPMTASAAGLTSGSASIVVHDADVDHVSFDPITGPKIAGTPFAISAHAYNIANEVIVVYSASGTLGASGQAGTLPISPTSVTFASGSYTGNVTLTVADPSVMLSLNSSGLSTSSTTFAVTAGAAASFTWGTIGSSQTANVPFSETLTAKDANGNVATGFNGSVNLSGVVGSSSSQTMLGSPVFTTSNNTGTFTVGYAFTPSSNIQVTAVRSYFGTKVSFWTNTGTLLASQAVSGSPTVWTETNMSPSITLLAGTTYRITVYTAGQVYYWRTVAPTNPTFASLGQTYEVSGDAFPTSTDTGQYWLVDLRGNVGSSSNVPVNPITAAFVNGVWTGNVAVTQGAAGMHLHADDGSGHIGDSNTFNVVVPAPVSLSGAASYYLRLDADTQHIDVWNNNTGTGAFAQQLVRNQITTLSLTTAGGAGSIVIDDSAGNVFPAGGLTLVGDGNTSSEIIGSGAGDTVAVNAGQVIVDGIPIALSGTTQLTFDPHGGTDALSVNSGTVILAATPVGGGVVIRSFSTLAIAAGAELQVATPVSHSDRALLVIGNLTIAALAGNWTGLLDLGGNDMDVQSGNLATISSQASAGYNFLSSVNWQAEGLTSNLASSQRMLSVILNDEDGSPVYGSSIGQSLFDGISPGASDVLVKYTYFGDANLDGKVDASDYTLVDNGFNSSLNGWFNGDFNYDGSINGDDYTLIDNAYNTQGTIGLAVILVNGIAVNTAQISPVKTAADLRSATRAGEVRLVALPTAGVSAANSSQPILSSSAMDDFWKSRKRLRLAIDGDEGNLLF